MISFLKDLVMSAADLRYSFGADDVIVAADCNYLDRRRAQLRVMENFSSLSMRKTQCRHRARYRV